MAIIDKMMGKLGFVRSYRLNQSQIGNVFGWIIATAGVYAAVLLGVELRRTSGRFSKFVNECNVAEHKKAEEELASALKKPEYSQVYSAWVGSRTTREDLKRAGVRMTDVTHAVRAYDLLLRAKIEDRDLIETREELDRVKEELAKLQTPGPAPEPMRDSRYGIGA
jgi:hypothetical protein